jgi:hypothetical protein
LTLCKTSSFFFQTIGPTGLLHPSPAPHFKTSLYNKTVKPVFYVQNFLS